MFRHNANLRHLSRGAAAFWPLANAGALELRSFGKQSPSTLTNVNTVTRTSGPTNNIRDAANFVVASSQALTLAAQPWHNSPGGAPFWIACWAMTDGVAAAAFRRLVSKEVTTLAYRLYATNSQLTPAHIGEYSDGSTVPTNTNGVTMNTTNWSFVTYLVYGGKVYLRHYRADQKRGSPSRSSLTAGSVNPNTGTLSIGAGTGGTANFWSGKIAHVYMNFGYAPDDRFFDWLWNNGQGRVRVA